LGSAWVWLVLLLAGLRHVSNWLQNSNSMLKDSHNQPVRPVEEIRRQHLLQPFWTRARTRKRVSPTDDEGAGHGGAAKEAGEQLTPMFRLCSLTFWYQRVGELLKADLSVECKEEDVAVEICLAQSWYYGVELKMTATTLVIDAQPQWRAAPLPCGCTAWWLLVTSLVEAWIATALVVCCGMWHQG
jgi:hypothetical protein